MQLVAAVARGARRVRINHACAYGTRARLIFLGRSLVEARPSNSLSLRITTVHSRARCPRQRVRFERPVGHLFCLRGFRPLRTIVFASFAAEELGLCGAAEYCRRYRHELPQIRAMVNLDALAWGRVPVTGA